MQHMCTQKIPSIFELELPSTTMNLFDQNIPRSPIEFEEKVDLKVDQLKGLWSPSEDELLRKAVSVMKQPISWEEISKFVPGRTPKQCRERWLFRLCPDVNKAPFQKWEDELIVLERQKIGNHWTAIAAKLPGRTSCAVKNRWYTVLRNRVQKPVSQRVFYPPVEALSVYYFPQFMPQYV
ncbi:Myb-like DNA-binding domain containing protein [Trichomonas vaginalis G3]|uniref:Myb-like DNA-binding domain containing protein n=1 Tax=Trichomonas vaginalis (strain ATCC PRA-98 / G3) TaxID=412133 RepID=A2DQY7_TRIV3|nr:RNA polymerase II transcription regulator recruiting protein [Trichomonas vaginalis G3]EAY17254.1 Myb-like DNA-binding domain containing protein [Trichomonas vaginalis G3]KAI5486215.1 RNA polymerase II transcription regulator recruiting protein [Trichomonas vaginalis G3]|eukprot:XP_001329477.1 Myb-like DNA-binding domain containing protein [Trichomonas vaginalis G3]